MMYVDRSHRCEVCHEPFRVSVTSVGWTALARLQLRRLLAFVQQNSVLALFGKVREHFVTYRVGYIKYTLHTLYFAYLCLRLFALRHRQRGGGLHRLGRHNVSVYRTRHTPAYFVTKKAASAAASSSPSSWWSSLLSLALAPFRVPRKRFVGVTCLLLMVTQYILFLLGDVRTLYHLLLIQRSRHSLIRIHNRE
eukprot:TRINITY_DN66689_c6_g2_i1.p2 TRINITY_DN66689_c6_g2~~TRINITY_DN66689_c6_g2_i1.p2  ORF type:complete len:213 (+),score=96.31 TRINITY_DN66689_c6_g2_i1:59-640(+)